MSTRSSRRRNLSPKDSTSFVVPISPTFTTNVNVRKRRQKENVDISLNSQGITRASSVLKERTENILNGEQNYTNETDNSAQIPPRKSRNRKSRKTKVSSASKEDDGQNSDLGAEVRPVSEVGSDGSSDMNVTHEKKLSTNRTTKRKSKKHDFENKVEENTDKPIHRKSKRVMLHSNGNLNKSCDSLESFHSAAGSPESYAAASQSTIKNNLTKQNISPSKKIEIETAKNNITPPSINSKRASNATYEKIPDVDMFYPAITRNSNSLTSEDDVTLNITVEKKHIKRTRSSRLQDKLKISDFDGDTEPLNTTFDNVFNTSPSVLLNMDDSVESQNGDEKSDILQELTKIRPSNSQTPLKRDSTFIKERSSIFPQVGFGSLEKCLDISQTKINTPIRKKVSAISEPGSTPYHLNIRSSKRVQSGNKSAALLNITRSIEKGKSSNKRRSTSLDVKRRVRVAFCSPAQNNLQNTTIGNKIIKSSLKGSNKSFVYEESVKSISRKRSLTQNDADFYKKKPKVISDKLNESVNRLSRPKTPQGKLNTSVTKVGTPLAIKTGTVTKLSSRGKAPNFAVLHKKQFDKMESLGECKERKEKRAKQLLFPSFEKSSNASKGSEDANVKMFSTDDVKDNMRPFTLKDPKMTNSKYNRFGFKLNSTIGNCFSIAKSEPTNGITEASGISNSTVSKKVNGAANGKLNETQARNFNVSGVGKLNRTVTSQLNTTVTKPVVRGTKEKAKETLMRENTSILQRKKSENRNVIKGVRMNRRFELQMKMRNISMDP